MRTSNDTDIWVWPEADWYREIWHDNDENPPQQQFREKQTPRKIQEEDGSTQVQQDKDKQVRNEGKALIHYHYYHCHPCYWIKYATMVVDMNSAYKRTLQALQVRRRRPRVVWF